MDFIGSMFLLLGAALCFFVWLLPIVLIGASSRTHGGEKFAWILAVIFVSWFAWVFYLLLAPLKPPQRERYRYRY